MRDLRDPFIRFKDKTPEEMFKGVKTPFFAMDEKRSICGSYCF